MNPLARASVCCCVLKCALERRPRVVVVITITAAITIDTMVSGTLSTIMLVSVATMVMTELSACGRLWLIICRKVSTSLV